MHPPLAELYVQDVFAKMQSSTARAPIARPAPWAGSTPKLTSKLSAEQLGDCQTSLFDGSQNKSLYMPKAILLHHLIPHKKRAKIRPQSSLSVPNVGF